LEDLERARCYGNEFGRPFGRSRPVSAASWSGRVTITPEACDAFREALARHREALAATRHAGSGRSRLALDERTAITRALIDLLLVLLCAAAIMWARRRIGAPRLRGRGK
jgi:hypothetical protein